MNQFPPTIWIVSEDDDDVLLMKDSLYRLGTPCQLLVFTDAPALLDHVNRFHESPSLLLIDYLFARHTKNQPKTESLNSFIT